MCRRATVSRILVRHGLPALAVLDPVTGAVIRASRATDRRYERAVAGEVVDVDVKKLGRIRDGGGWRALGPTLPRYHGARGERIGFDYVHTMVDDHSRLAYAEIHPDEKGHHVCGVPSSSGVLAAHRLTVQQVMTDNAKNYVRSQHSRS